MDQSEIDLLEGMLDKILSNEAIDAESFPENMKGIQERLLKLQQLHKDLQTFAIGLSQGDIDATPPPRNNYLAAGLKQLQAQIRHLAWQASCIAEGDYNQRVDFMGEFSESFNRMIIQLRDREAHLKEQQMVMELIFDRLDFVMFVKDEENDNIIYANQIAKQRFDMEHISQEKMLNELLSLPPDCVEHEIYDGENEKWYSVMKCNIHWTGQASASLYYFIDITLHKERETDLEHAANTDKLTGIYNRRAFEMRYLNLWEMCKKGRKPLSVLMFDIDNFKRFNDTYGHLSGDEVLILFAQVMERCVGRADDVVARYGGEEFIVLLPFTGEENAMMIAEHICRSIATEKLMFTTIDGEDILASITVSGGVCSVIPSDDISPEDLIKKSDAALYEAKQSGRNRVKYHSFEKESEK